MNSFRIQVAVRILLALVFGGAAVYFWVYTPFWLLSGWMVLFLIISVAMLIRFVERSDRELTNFLLSIQQSDFTNTYPQTRQNSKRLYAAFNAITSEFLKVRNEKESNFHLLKTVVEHSGVPLLAYTIADEQVVLVNKSAKDLFEIPHFTRLGALDRIGPEVAETIRALRTGEKVLLRVSLSGEPTHLSIVARELEVQGTRSKVIALHNINSELDQKEVESWQKLIRVMAHEIKNSVIPIATLAEVINEMVDKGKGLKALDREGEEDLVVSIQTIEKRSKGLVKFVTSYGDLARVPRPEPLRTDLSELLRGVVQLQGRYFSQAGIALEVQLPRQPIMLMLDTGMIEQVVINLLKNAAEALAEADTPGPCVHLRLVRQATEVVVQVQDNGPGMEEEVREQVFIPFFTTKKEGSGIGLSYSKQVMRAHKGNLRVKSKPGEGALFELSFWLS